MKTIGFLVVLITISQQVFSQGHQHHTSNDLPFIENVDAQPVMSHALKVADALSHAGSQLPEAIHKELAELKNRKYDEVTVRRVQEILDPYVLAFVDINAESRVKVFPGVAEPVLKQEGWSTFLVKVNNRAHVTAVLEAESPNASPIFHRSSSSHRMLPENELTDGQLDNRFIELVVNRNRPLSPNLSGLDLEYAIIHIYTKETGKRMAELGFNVGQGSQDLGFRNTIDILFDIKPAVKVIFDVKDHNHEPVMGSFIITDNIERYNIKENNYLPDSYRIKLARKREFENWESDPASLSTENRLVGIYPLPAQRLASRDDFPDFFFQPQIYRQDGEYVYLSPGTYQVIYGRGPEYLMQSKEIVVPEGVDSMKVDFRLERWIDMTALGWNSYDHHIHAAGCSHYESPEEGVEPEHMWRQIQGEDLDIGSNLTWGPGWYYQKQFFTGESHPLTDEENVLRYDIEVSGFPSDHSGHLLLLNIKEDDYPNTTTIEEWPSWTLPVLEWGKSQGGITGYAHSGWGLFPIEPTFDLPNYITPRMDGIGANEYVVTITHDLVDIYSLGDTPAYVELNMWYHSLSSGFRVRASGETDFPCITDERVGLARTYAKCDLTFASLMKAVKEGKTYVSDGFTHLIDFTVNDVELGEAESEVRITDTENLQIKVKAASRLDEKQSEIGANIASRRHDEAPYWHVERARNGDSRKVPVELIVNGYPVAVKDIVADGNWNDLEFNYKIDMSSWIAVRVYPSAHTNPIFVLVDEKPIRVEKSVEWMRNAVDQSWKMKQPQIRDGELEAAERAYNHARTTYDEMLNSFKN